MTFAGAVVSKLMPSRSCVLRVMAAVVGWLVLLSIAVAAPRDAAASTTQWSNGGSKVATSTASIGVRSSTPRAHEAVMAFRLDAAADTDSPHDLCETDAWQDVGTCADDGDGEPAPEPPEPEPTPDHRADAEASLDDAISQIAANFTDQEPEAEFWPTNNLQQVHLDMFMYVSVGWHDPALTATGLMVGEQAVTVTATPTRSKWEFADEQGGTASVSCANRGERWSEGDDDPLCGKRWFHSSPVTGWVTVQLCVEYTISWHHQPAGFATALVSGTEPLDHCTHPDTKLWVNETLSFGIDERGQYGAPDHQGPGGIQPKGECHWAAAPLGWFSPFDCETITRVAKLIKDGLLGCAQGIWSQAKQLWGLVEEIGEQGAVGFIRTKISELDSMKDEIVELAKTAEGREQLALAGVGLPPDPENMTDSEWAGWVGETVCGMLIGYITGSLGTRLLKILDDLPGRNRPDRESDSGNDSDSGDSSDDGGSDGPVCSATGGGCRCDNSFPPGTQVLMGDGNLRAIETIQPGDTVLSHNLDTGAWEPKHVLAQWSHPERGPPTTASFADGTSITATADHPFYVVDTNEWTELQHVAPGDQLLTPAGPVDVINLTVGPSGHPWTVWELTVASNHNYTVHTGTHAVLVHNCTSHTDADGNTTLIHDDGTVDYIDKDGNVFEDVHKGPDGLPMIDSNGAPIPKLTGEINADWGIDEAFIGDDGWPRYPENSGRVAGTEEYGFLDPNGSFDRFGAAAGDNPQYGAYLGEPGASLADRGLPPNRPDGYEIYDYTPKAGREPLPTITSEVQPWFGQQGGGIQIEFDVKRAKELYAGHPDFDQMFNGDRLALDYWFDID